MLILELLEEDLKNIDAILLSDYNKGLLTERLSKKIIKLAKENGKVVMVDPKPQNFKNYIGATSITPNKKEILDYFGMKKFSSEEEIVEKLDEKNEFFNNYKEYKKEVKEAEVNQDEQKELEAYQKKLEAEGYDEFEILEKLTIYQNELHKSKNLTYNK